MLWVGILLVILGPALMAISTRFTRRYIIRHNPMALLFSPAELKAEWKRLAGTGVVPSWVSLIGLLGWACLLVGLALIYGG